MPNLGTSNPFPIQTSNDAISWDTNPTYWMKFELNRVTLLLNGQGTGTLTGNTMSDLSP